LRAVGGQVEQLQAGSKERCHGLHTACTAALRWKEALSSTTQTAWVG
jgi:hypothetical protein